MKKCKKGVPKVVRREWQKHNMKSWNKNPDRLSGYIRCRGGKI